METNTVFMGIMVFLHNYYRYFLCILEGKGFGLKKTSRVKAFVFRFASVQMGDRGGPQDALALYGQSRLSPAAGLTDGSSGSYLSPCNTGWGKVCLVVSFFDLGGLAW